MTGPFAAVAVDYSRAGLSPFPCGGDDGKRPAVKGWQRRRTRKLYGWRGVSRSMPAIGFIGT